MTERWLGFPVVGQFGFWLGSTDGRQKSGLLPAQDGFVEADPSQVFWDGSGGFFSN
jgi:hypothetical protein